MKKLLSILMCCVLCVSCAQPETNVVQDFIQVVKTNNPEKISKFIKYPLGRPYPVPAVADADDFINRYDELFDKRLRDAIVESDAEKDWSPVGWRGIMLHNGTMWLDYDGKVIGINYVTGDEYEKKQKIIDDDRSNLHESLQEFKRPELVIETEKYRVRIDEMDGYKYRYASWAKGTPMSQKPDLIISGGDKKFDGSGGNHGYRFKSGRYEYVVYVTVIGHSESAPYNLWVEKDGKEILYQSAEAVK